MRSLWVLAVVLAAAGCSGDVSSPGPSTVTTTPCGIDGESLSSFASGSYLRWETPNGCAVSIDLIAHSFGEPNCGFEPAEFITLGPPAAGPDSSSVSNRYVWNADGVIPGLDPGRTIPISDLPSSALDSGYRQGDAQLWLEEAAAFVVVDGRARVFERIPLALSYCG